MLILPGSRLSAQLRGSRCDGSIDMSDAEGIQLVFFVEDFDVLFISRTRAALLRSLHSLQFSKIMAVSEINLLQTCVMTNLDRSF